MLLLCFLGSFVASEDPPLVVKVLGMKYTLPDFSKCFGKISRAPEEVDWKAFSGFKCLDEALVTLVTGGCVVRTILIVGFCGNVFLVVVLPAKTVGDLFL